MRRALITIYLLITLLIYGRKELEALGTMILQTPVKLMIRYVFILVSRYKQEDRTHILVIIKCYDLIGLSYTCTVFLENKPPPLFDIQVLHGYFCLIDKPPILRVCICTITQPHPLRSMYVILPINWHIQRGKSSEHS